MGHRANRHIVLVLVSCLLAGFVLAASAQMATGPIEPGAGGWRTWVLASGKELRLAPPPDAQATATELQELRTLAGQRDAAAIERIRHLFPCEATRYQGWAQGSGSPGSGRESTSGATWRRAGRSGAASPRLSSSVRNTTVLNDNAGG